MRAIVPVLMLASLATAWSLSAAAGDSDYTLTLKNHQFTPANMVLPKDTRLKLTLINADKTPAEFESQDLGFEKIVPGGGTISVYVGPLGPGEYSFFDEFNQDESTASLTVK